eukprot:GFYU01001220.1.p1 GENE.GFYU01001220.1~~GFYU01001220.1.p1  ORF type:complete len:199 (+),score=69.56 GFYU01001220.1:129-725(+)
MENQLFQLKFTAKQLAKASKKCEKAEKAEKTKLKKAIEKGNMDGARLYAQNAIRQKNQGMNYLRLASRVDAVASRFEIAVKMNQVTKAIGGVVKSMDSALGSMDVEKISHTMDAFEKQFEDMDVKSDYVENAINSTTTMTTPDDEVNELIAAVADENSLNIEGQFDQLGKVGTAQASTSKKAEEEDDLTERLRKLQEP